jgi:hypothetical protein
MGREGKGRCIGARSSSGKVRAGRGCSVVVMFGKALIIRPHSKIPSLAVIIPDWPMPRPCINTAPYAMSSYVPSEVTTVIYSLSHLV